MPLPSYIQPSAAVTSLALGLWMYSAMPSFRLSFSKGNFTFKDPLGIQFYSAEEMTYITLGLLFFSTLLSLKLSATPPSASAPVARKEQPRLVCGLLRLTVTQSVMLFEIVYVLLQSCRVPPSRPAMIAPITLAFGLQLSSIWGSQLSPVLCSTLDLFCSKQDLLLQWIGYVTGHPFLTFNMILASR